MDMTDTQAIYGSGRGMQIMKWVMGHKRVHLCTSSHDGHTLREHPFGERQLQAIQPS